MFRSKNRVRRLAAVAVIAVLAMAAFGFAAANTVPASKAGDGSGAITGYIVSGITYTLDTNNPSNLSDVAFTLDAAATTVRAATNGNSPTVACTNTGGNNWTCPIAASTNSAVSLFVAAAE